MNNYLLSIIIPAYNRPDNLAILLSSIADIDNDFREQIEVIISDDSPDPSPLPAVTSKYSNILNIKYFKNPSSIHAPGTNRKNGLNHATGKWVMFIDDDDALLSYNMTFVKIYLKDAKDDVIMFRSKWFEWEEDDTLWINNHCNITLNMITHGKIYRKSFIDNKHITYSDEYKYNEDAYFNYQFYPYIYGSKKYKEVSLDFSFYKFLNNKNSISRRVDEEGDAFDKAVRNNTYSWIDSYFFNTIPTLDTFTQQERQDYYIFLLPNLIYIVRGMNWLEDNNELNKDKLELYEKFFYEWKRLFNDDIIMENHFCVEEFYLEKRLYINKEHFFNVLDRVHTKSINLIEN